jgi:hypothetical protein
VRSAVSGPNKIAPRKLRQHGLVLASLFVRDLQHFFGRGSFISIVLPPKEREILVHLMSPAVVDPSTSTI